MMMTKVIMMSIKVHTVIMMMNIMISIIFTAWRLDEDDMIMAGEGHVPQTPREY